VSADRGTGATEVPALELAGVSAAYGPYRALFDVSVTVGAGAAVALIGANGSGKSTVARVATGLVVPTAGSVTVAGHPVTGLAPWRIARLGVAHVPEGRGVFADLSVEENLRLNFRARGPRGRVDESLERAYEAFPMLGRRRGQRAGSLSGGQQRMLSLAAVLVVPPRLLVADELSLGLSPAVIDEVYEGLRRIHRGGTALLVVEQQIDRVLELCDRAVVLDRGRVAYAGAPDGAVAAVESVLVAKGERTVLVSAPASSGRSPDATPEDHETAHGWSRRGRRLG
jgi:branched-chain amino acid transport system ATP-binding protein